MSLAAAILAELPAEMRSETHDEVVRRADEALAAIRTRWPEAPEAGDAFVAHAAARVRGQPGLPGALARLRLDDLFLAWWAASGDARGIAAFEAAHAESTRRLLARFHRLDADELAQRLRIKLFAGEAPRALEYTGFGFLENWYRVVATRTFLDVARGTARARFDALPEALLELADPNGGDPVLLALRAEVTEALKRALASAVEELAPRDRTFLRMLLVDALSIEQIARTYGLHRVTVSKALGAARKTLHEAARARVIAELGIDPDRLASAMRVLDSQLDLSLPRLLR